MQLPRRSEEKKKIETTAAKYNVIAVCIPKKTVAVGPRDPDFVTPLVKVLLNKRNTVCVDVAKLRLLIMLHVKLMTL